MVQILLQDHIGTQVRILVSSPPHPREQVSFTELDYRYLIDLCWLAQKLKLPIACTNAPSCGEDANWNHWSWWSWIWEIFGSRSWRCCLGGVVFGNPRGHQKDWFNEWGTFPVFSPLKFYLPTALLTVVWTVKSESQWEQNYQTQGSLFGFITTISLHCFSTNEFLWNADWDCSLDCQLEIIVSAAQHDNIVGFRGIAKNGSSTFLVMEYCPRGTLDVMLHHTRMTRWDLTKVLQMVRGIARGMLHLHTRKPPILHRDLKPG